MHQAGISSYEKFFLIFSEVLILTQLIFILIIIIMATICRVPKRSSTESAKCFVYIIPASELKLNITHEITGSENKQRAQGNATGKWPSSGGTPAQQSGPQSSEVLIMAPFGVPVVSATHGFLRAALWPNLKVYGLSPSSAPSVLKKPFCSLLTAVHPYGTCVGFLCPFPTRCTLLGNGSSLAPPSSAAVRCLLFTGART